MMNIEVLAVGRIKEKYLIDAIEEYTKRLSKYCKLNILEVADEKADKAAGTSEIELVKKTEGEKLIKNIDRDAFLVTLEIDGKQITSEELSENIENWAVSGKGRIQFVIGGSHGLHKSVCDAANYHLSFSKMTFPHQIMRVILLEQIYRGFKISHNEPYHK